MSRSMNFSAVISVIPPAATNTASNNRVTRLSPTLIAICDRISPPRPNHTNDHEKACDRSRGGVTRATMVR